jgi:hypothetical protein
VTIKILAQIRKWRLRRLNEAESARAEERWPRCPAQPVNLNPERTVDSGGYRVETAHKALGIRQCGVRTYGTYTVQRTFRLRASVTRVCPRKHSIGAASYPRPATSIVMQAV